MMSYLGVIMAIAHLGFIKTFLCSITTVSCAVCLPFQGGRDLCGLS